jgi:hypothetical protein
MDTKKAAAWFIVSLMVFSIFGIIGSSFFSEDQSNYEEISYNDYKFIKKNAKWELNHNDQKYYFDNLPNELINYSLPEYAVNTDKIYLGYQPNDKIDPNLGIQMIGNLLFNQKILVQKACFIEEGCPNIPLIDCEEDKGIIFVSSIQEGYTIEKKCLIIGAEDNQQLIKLTEKLAYHLLGIL